MSGGSRTAFEEWLIQGMTEEQEAAVTAEPHESIMLQAGAGTGKTRCLTHRLAWLAARGVPLSRILAVTFTRKAAAEMDGRLVRIFGLEGRGGAQGAAQWPRIGTFHRICAQLLRRHHGHVAEVAGRTLPRDFTILDESDQRKVLRRGAAEVVEERNAEEEREAREAGGDAPVPRSIEDESVRHVVEALDRNARREIGRERLLAALRAEEVTVVFARTRGRDPVDLPAADVIEAYERYKERYGCVDYDDLVQIATALCEQVPEAVPRLEHVLVDEFQDTNALQLRWLEALTLGNGCPLFAVGDANQMIYGWRGARIEHLEEEGIGGRPARRLHLTVNFRSPPGVLDAANRALVANRIGARHRRPLAACPARAGEARLPIPVLGFDNAWEEGGWIADTIRQAMAGGGQAGQWAVLARARRAWITLEPLLARARIPYEVVAGRRFAERPEIRDVNAWVRIALNPCDDEACERILVRGTGGFGQASVRHALAWARGQGRPLAECLPDLGRNGVVRKGAGLAATRVAQALRALGRILDAGEPPRRLLDAVLECSGVQAAVEGLAGSADPEEAAAGRIQQSRLEDLVLLAEDCRTALDLHEQLAVGDTPVDGGKGGVVTLGTIHGAKGREFDHVLVMAMNEDVLPSAGGEEEDPGGGIEEERRIAHVAYTRARRTLGLTWSAERRGVPSERSRFVDELGPAAVEYRRPGRHWDGESGEG